MNYRASIKKLHETFPDFDIDTIIKILDCIVEDNVTPINGFQDWRNIPLKTSNSNPWNNITFGG